MMADINIEMLKEKLYKVQKALFCMGEVCVDVSKQHISETDALKKIRGYLNDAQMCSRLDVDRLIAECMDPKVYNTFGDQHNDWTRNLFGKWVGLDSPTINYPDCCDGCSNNPKNGGSGICNCTLPYMQNPTNYTVGTGGYVYTTTTSLPDVNDHSVNVAEAVDRAKKYEKRG